jgi:hypothetical protein
LDDPELIHTLISSAKADAHQAIALFGLSLEAFRDVVEVRDRSIDEAGRAVLEQPGPDGRMIKCKAGCAHCCHQMVHATPLEALLIADAIRTSFTEAETEALVARLVALMRVPANEADRTSRKLPCPLLENNSCSIYKIRPHVCRALYSYSATACSKGLDASTRTRGASIMVPSPDIPYKFASALNMGLDATLLEHGLDTERVDLAGGLHYALTHKEAATDWLAGKDIFAPFRTVGPLFEGEPLRNDKLVKMALESYGIS